MVISDRKRRILTRTPWLFFLLALGVVLLSACTDSQQANLPAPTEKSYYEVAPLFREYYQALGGEALLGPAISPLIENSGSLCQYTYKVFMCHNPSLPDTIGGFYLGDLGTLVKQDYNINDSLGAATGQTSTMLINGYDIYPDFIALYENLYGTLSTGQPLTRPLLNYDLGRVEQYFENMVLAHDFDAPPGESYLLSLGAVYCSDNCRNDPTQTKDVFTTTTYSPFAMSIERMGGPTIFGSPITKPFISENDMLVQVFENMIVFAPADSQNPNDIRVFPLSTDLQMPTTPAGPKLYDLKDNVIFHPIDPETGWGYHVPIIFNDFIEQHGGKWTSGQPISEPIFYDQEGLYRQCFTNYCLEYNPNDSSQHAIRVLPLGIQFLRRGLENGSISSQDVADDFLFPEYTSLTLNQEKTHVGPSENQIVTIEVVRSDRGTPLEGIESQILITLPDSSQFTLNPSATNADGKASIEIPSIPNLENGSIINYQVCLHVTSGDPICASGAYLFWQAPE